MAGRTEFVMGRHSYSFKGHSPQAMAFTALLGAYRLLPIYTEGYNLLNGSSYLAAARGSLTDVRESDAAEMLAFWNGVVNKLLRNDAYKGADQWQTVYDNAKLRLPVLIQIKDGRWALVYETDGDTAKIYDPGDPGNFTAAVNKSRVERAFDTLKYMKALTGVNEINVKHCAGSITLGVGGAAIGADGETLGIGGATPGTDGISLGSGVKTGVPPTATKPDTVAQSVNNGALTLTAVGANANFTAGTRVAYGAGGMPDITRDTNIFNLMKFKDMTNPGEWYWEYVYRAVDAGVMNGDAEGTMRPADYLKRGELIKIAMTAIGKTCANADGKGAHWAANYYAAARDDGWVNAGTADLYKYLEEYINRRETMFIFWKAFRSGYRVNASGIIPAADPGTAYYRSIFKDPGEMDVLINSAMYEAFFQLNKSCIIVGDPQDADGKIAFRVNDRLSRAECAKISMAFLFGLGEDAPLFGEYRGMLTAGGGAAGSLNGEGRAAYDFYVPKTAPYEISAGGLAVTVTENGKEIFVKYNRENAYPLTLGAKVRITVKGGAGAAFTIKASAPLKGKPLTPSDRAIYIMLYDSPDKKANGFVRNRYLGIANGSRYLYSKEFFKNYMTLADGKNVKLCVSIRDLDFDKAYNSDHYYSNADIQMRIKVIEPQIIAATNNIIELMKAAKAELPGVAVPGVYIGSPHMYGEAYAANGNIGEKRKFANEYAALTKRIYDGAAAAAGNAVPIEGIYYGREDPVMGGTPLEGSVGYIAMEAVSSMIHTQYVGKKMVWVPYVVGKHENMKGIGEIANTGIFACNGRTYDLCDAVIMQPGYFYSEIGNVPAKDKKALMEGGMRDSVADQTVYAWGAAVGGGKTTETVLGFEMEYDMSLVTGRWHSLLSTPKLKAQYLRETISAYKPMLDAGAMPFAIYSGGPNEQRYEDATAAGNLNRHSTMNHQSYCGKNYPDWGDDEQYQSFTSAKMAEPEGGNPDFGHYAPFDGKLIYNITKGLLGKGWEPSVNSFLGSAFK